jgi:HEAT repeat protein
VSLLDDPNDSVVHSALEYLLAEKAPEARDKLIALLSHPNSSIRVRAVMAITDLVQQDAAEYLIPLLDDENPRVCSMAASRLCSLNHGEAQPRIVRLMQEHPLAYVREGIAKSMGNMTGTPPCSPLIQVLFDENARVSERAAESLGKLRCEEAAQPLLQVIHENPARHRKAIEALGRIRSAEARRHLQELFSQPDLAPVLKLETGFALAESGDLPARQYLREELARLSRQHSNPFLRDYVVRFARMGDYSTVPLLISYLEDRSQTYHYSQRNHYGQILTELTGKHYGWDAKRWTKWWEKNNEELLPSAYVPQNPP